MKREMEKITEGVFMYLNTLYKGKKLSNPASARPSEASAYTTTKYWPNAKYPSSNLEDRVPKLLNEKKYSNLFFSLL